MTRPVSNAEVERAVWVVQESGVADILESELRKSNRGRPLWPNLYEIFLVGAILTVQLDGEFLLNTIHETLTKGIAEPWQQRLGIRRRRSTPDENGNWFDLVSADNINLITQRVTRYLSYTEAYASRLHPSQAKAYTDEERARRYGISRDITQRLIRATHIVGHESGLLAIDGSGSWAWMKGRRGVANTDIDELSTEALAWLENVDEEEAKTLRSFVKESAIGASVSADWDARWGVKTSIETSGRMPYFGYEIHAAVRVPKQQWTEPVLIQELIVTSPIADLADVTLELIDEAATQDTVEGVLVDRHYSYKEPAKWATELTKRGIDQYLDLRKDDHAFTTDNGVRMAAGWPHCPKTPEHLGTIIKPGPAAKDSDDKGSAEYKEFNNAIDERARYAMKRIGAGEEHGDYRYMCPARNGQIGCSLVAGSVEAADETEIKIINRDGTTTFETLPVIDKPPAPEAQYRCCTQETFTVKAADHGKLRQRHYWGSKKWSRIYGRRTYVETVFGNIKNQSTENVKRGHHRLAGLANINIVFAIDAVAYNMRQLRSWHEDSGQGPADHPLLRPDPPDYGFDFLDQEEANERIEPPPSHTQNADDEIHEVAA